MELLKPFNQLTKNDANIAGGKGASLGEMTNSKIPVPQGFVILSDSFEKFLEETDLNIEIDSILHKVDHQKIHTVEQASEKIEALILNAEMPKDIASEIKDAFIKMDSKYVAVRSSATAEDSASAAWAGQLESYLNTTEESLLENVKRCWASLFTPRAIFYRFEKDLHKTKISVAVVVQKMVESEMSGIAFSVHPVTQDRNQLIIEAGLGLGEAIVSGQITPDSYVVEKEPRRIIDTNVVTQTRGLYRKENGGNEWCDIPKERGEKQVLSDEKILELSEIILQIEKHYGFPCDIEWAFEDGKFYIVQSRPITTLLDEKSNISKPKIEKTITRDISLIDIYAWHQGYTLGMQKWLGWSYSDSVFYIHDGYTEIMRPPHEHMVDFRDQITQKIDSDEDWFHGESKKLDILTTEIFKFYDNCKNKIDSFSDSEIVDVYEKYVDYISRVMGSFITMFWLPIWFEKDENKKERYKKEIDIAIKYRKITEHIFPSGAELTNNILSKVSKETKINEGLLRVLSAEELKNYFNKKIIPDENILKERAKGFVYSKKGIILTDNTPENFKKVIEDIGYDFVPPKHENVEEIKGQLACKGKVRGMVRVIMSKKDILKIEDNEVLVTAMTTPEYLPAMIKSCAFVTDEGGVTCHAAIVAREMKKPCIIGTKIATQVLKDGDLVEVDADNGIVRILERK